MTSAWTLMNAYEGFILSLWGSIGPSFVEMQRMHTGIIWKPGTFKVRDPRLCHLCYPCMVTNDGGQALALDPYSQVELFMEVGNVTLLLDVFNPSNPDEREDYWIAYPVDQLSDELLSQISLMYTTH